MYGVAVWPIAIANNGDLVIFTRDVHTVACCCHREIWFGRSYCVLKRVYSNEKIIYYISVANMDYCYAAYKMTEAIVQLVYQR